MTKTELLTALNGKFYLVSNPVMKADLDGLKWYMVKVYDKINDSLRDTTIAFYVENEGEGGEVAYWSPSEPKPTPVTGFALEVSNYIQAKITDGTIEGGFVNSVDNAKEIAYGTAIVDVSGDLQEKKILVDKDGETIRHRMVT